MQRYPIRPAPRLFLALFAAAAVASTGLRAAPVTASPGAAFGTPVAADLLDPASFAEWNAGRETPVAGPAGEAGPQAILFTSTTRVAGRPVKFGDTAVAGPRHLRIGFKSAVPVGSVLAHGGGALSVLKPGASYPGDPGDDEQWIPAERIKDGEPSRAGTGGFALWVLPPGTTTRALRFTHVADITDLRYAGELSGALVLRERMINLGASARVSASANPRQAARVVNEQHDGWSAWENQAKGKPEKSRPVSRDNAEWLVLSWREPVAVRELVALWAGAAAVEVQAFAGADGENPATAADASWRTVREFSGIRHEYPAAFWPNRLDLGGEVTTRALRLRLLEAGVHGGHANNNRGHRVWMGEIMALAPLGPQPLQSVRTASGEERAHPPIPVRFALREAGFVTLVIERPDGFRVRNLISGTWFPAGENTAWWDGTDDLGRDVDAAMHGVYNIPSRFVEPGEYRVRGLVRGELKPSYEFSVYVSGNPPWNTADGTGAWLANHSPPQAAAFVPAEQSPTGSPVIYLGCYVTEGPAGLAWVDLEGRKRGGKRWIGGNWTAAPFLAPNLGRKAVDGVHVYVGSTFETGKKSGITELRLTAVTSDGDKVVLKRPLHELLKEAASAAPADEEDNEGAGAGMETELGGIAACDGVLAVSLTARNRLLIVDARTGDVLGLAALDAPRGLAFDTQGRLHALSGKRVVRFASLSKPAEAKPETIVAERLDAPAGLAFDRQGNLLVSDQGASHQVKVFTAAGRFVREIGRPGAPKAGPYDPLRMQNPLGLAVDAEGRIWVAEHDYMPKRVSVWSADGRLVRAFYGPAKYGGGGALDPVDRTRFYYADEGKGTLEFKLDWERGGFELANVLYRRGQGGLVLPRRTVAPEMAFHLGGRRYFTNCYNNSPTGGSANVVIFAERDGLLRPVAALGRVWEWPQFRAPEFAVKVPEGMDFNSRHVSRQNGSFIWSDRNGDHLMQPGEIASSPLNARGVTVMPDLSFVVARFGEDTVRFAPASFDAAGVPLYEIGRPAVLARGAQPPASSGGDQAIAFDDGWAAVTLGVAPFGQRSISGTKDGEPRWSYPNLWPGLHASHRAPRPDRPGQLIGMTRLPGGAFEIAGTDAGPLWALHSNHGRMAFFTRDGLFVGNVFTDMRGGRIWRMPSAARGMDLTGVTLGEENFWPTVTHASGGKVYLVDGARSAIVRIDGFDTIKRIPGARLTVSGEDLDRSRAWQVESEAVRQRATGDGMLAATLRAEAPRVDGDVGEWPEAAFVDIDRSGVRAYFSSNSRPYDVSGAVAVAGDRLYVAWRTGNPKLLENTAEMPLAPFKTGGALDLMIGADPAADPARKNPVPGDARLVVTLAKGRPWALIYRGVVNGTPESARVPFSSPWRTITMDRVDDVSAQIEFAARDGNYEVSIPLAAFGLRPDPLRRIRGDIGILRGNGTETTARVYWHNKATGITADVPAEAALTPALWGVWEFRKP